MKRPEDVAGWARQRYINQRRRWLDGAGEWPLSLSLDRPSEESALRSPAAVRAWSEAWAGWASPSPQITVHTEAVSWQRLGSQTLPTRVSFGSPAAVARLVNEAAAWQRAVGRRQQLIERWPQLETAGVGSHFDVLTGWSDADFDRLVRLVQWFETNPNSGLYLRQLPVQGIDTKWIDLHRRGVVTNMLLRLRGRVDGDESSDELSALDFFERCGLRRPLARLRVLLLSPELRAAAGGLRDIEAPLEQLAALRIAPVRALVLENLETAHCLPDFPSTVAIVKLGNAISLAGQLPWMRDVPVTYWGDIDTHGFSILAQARRVLRSVTSVLMDEQTLAVHLERCVPEPAQATNADLQHLGPEEASVYGGLLKGTWGLSLRLEQERVSWDFALERLRKAMV